MPTQAGWVTVVPWAATAARLVVGGAFAYAGLLKLPDPAASARAVRAYQLLPESLVPAFGYGLPVLEVLIGLVLILGLHVRLGAVLASVLLVVFMAAIASAWARGLQIDCGCFDAGGEVGAGETSYGRELLRDAALLLTALALVRWPRSRLALDTDLHPPLLSPEETPR